MASTKEVEIKPEDKFPSLPDAYFRDMCYTCGVMHAISNEFLLSRVNSNRQIFCPNGHSGKIDKDYIKAVEGKIKVPFEDFEKITCGGCGITFMLEKGFLKLKQEDYSYWICPNGCRRSFTRPAPPPKTEMELDYGKMIAWHGALGQIALLKPKAFQNKKILKLAILIARNALELEKMRG